MEKKCSCCGSNNLYQLDKSDLISANELSWYADIYLCFDCKHIELFANDGTVDIAKKRINRKNRMEELESELNSLDGKLEKELEIIENDSKESITFEKALEDLKKKLDDENITVKEHNLLKEEYDKKQEEYEEFSLEICRRKNRVNGKISNRRREIEEELRQLEKNVI